MKQLFTGIYNKFTTGAPAIYTNLGGRLRLHEAKQGETFPYCVYFLIGTSPDFYFGEQKLFSTIVQFSLFTEERSASNIGTYYDNLIALYDESILTVADYSFLRMERTWDYLIRDAPEGVWQWSLQYRITMEKFT